jgi:hypothetical protein
MPTFDSLNPKQMEILCLLNKGPERVPSPEFRRDLAADLHARIEDALRPHQPLPADEDEGDRLMVRKNDITTVLDCEARWLASEWDGWSVDKLVGIVVHRAIEQHSLARAEVTPLDRIEMVLNWMTENDSPRNVAEFLKALNPMDRGDLMSEANNGFLAFIQHWPPLSRKWAPRAETSIYYDKLLDGAITLVSKRDLALGFADGMSARTIIVDVKTGRLHNAHAAELRYYALVETLQIGVPPFRVASYYTTTGNVTPQDITEDILFQTADKLTDVIKTMWELRAGKRAPVRVPGGLCENFCSLFDGCDEGQQFVADRE